MSSSSFTTRCALLLASLAAAVSGLDGIVTPADVAAGERFQVTFQGGNDDKYRVYLAASLAGSNGPACISPPYLLAPALANGPPPPPGYLLNSTTVSSPINLTIPAGVGPSADYYSIAIADLTTNQASTYSNRFNLTGADGNYTAYEDSLGGSPFWSADDLPCTAYPCARECAQASYPQDLTDTKAYQTMTKCILACNGVTPAASQTAPAHASSTAGSASSSSSSSSSSSPSSTTMTGEMAVITLGPGATVTAIETIKKGKTLAIIGDKTLTLGGSAATISSEAVSLATSGLDVGGSTTVAFSSTTATVAATVAEAAAATVSADSSASKRYMAGAAAAGFAGLAFVL
ncbi:Hypothetical predicted protein [Lecanosticta acicola]|uniref:Uncharacterized protein n=1 Tax=Lecanosticta acicola TaxID=111012 RepID=A0AAI9EBY0_9PEZI|nr:Hypothetical predicted protein [Lecanosticta acicola]